MDTKNEFYAVKREYVSKSSGKTCIGYNYYVQIGDHQIQVKASFENQQALLYYLLADGKINVK